MKGIRRRDGRSRAARRGASGGARPSRPAAARRRGLLIFTAAFAALFAIVALAEGIGHPDVPPGAVAVVDGAPGDAGTITEAELRRATEQVAAELGLEGVSNPSDRQYEALQERALGTLLSNAWLSGLAAEMEIFPSDGAVTGALEELKAQEGLGQAEYRKFLGESRLTPRELKQKLRLRLTGEALTERIESRPTPAPSASQVEDYYEAEKALRFTQPARRDIRLIFNLAEKPVKEAISLLEEDGSRASWRRVAERYSMDRSTRTMGGLLSGVTEESFPEPLSAAIFEAPEGGGPEGPTLVPRGYYAFQIVNATPERVQTLDQVREQVESELAANARQEALYEVLNDETIRWRSRTFCAPAYTVERCANFELSVHPANAPTGCYEANPEGGRPEACPAPVPQAIPARPGSVNAANPRGDSAAQRPHPAAAESSEG